MLKRATPHTESELTASPATRRKLDMVFETAPNDLDDDGHARMDESVLETAEDEPSNTTAAILLLATIVQKSENVLDPKYGDNSNAKNLLRGNPDLVEMLQVAWREKKFKEIRNLKILRPPFRRSSSPRRLSRLLNAEVHQRAVSNAWNEKYAGRHHRLLLDNINRMSREKPYSNSVAILQSSGSGKSRMVREQSNLVFTLPFNLRAHADDKDMAYPPPDNEIRNYLDWQAADLCEAKTRYLHLLGHLFKVVSDELGVLYSEKLPSYKALAATWREHVETSQNRRRMYATAVERCDAGDLNALQKKYPAPKGSLDPPSVYAVSEQAKYELDRLLQSIDNSCKFMEDLKTNHVKLMLYFDEAHILAEKTVPQDRDGKDMYDVLCSCFNAFLSLPIFVIYLSTSSNISQLAPQGSLARSARARENADALQAPITETPFDCCPTLSVKPGTLKLEDVSQIEFMAQFGRPIFWTLLAGASDHKSEILPTIIDLARAKLICHHKISVKHTELQPVASTAVLDVLLNLDFEPRREAARRREAQLVSTYMRTAFSIPQDREYFRSGYPSEPILAEAAARQMDEFQTLSPDINVMANILKADFSSGILDQGMRGEIVFRQLISEAYRRAVRKDYPDDPTPNFSKGCNLTTFITELFSKDYADQILNSVPDNLKSTTTFAEAFDDAIIRFTHFGKMADDTATTSYSMFPAFVRSMGVICWSSQDFIDFILPVLLRRGAMLQESSMTGLIIQIKRRKTKGSMSKYEINQKALGFFPAPMVGQADERPYITLVAEVGVQLPTSRTAVTKVKVRDRLAKSILNPRTQRPTTGKASTAGKASAASQPATPSKLKIPQQPVKMAHPRDTHPRYSIFAYGCSDTVYNVIRPRDRPLYRFLLGNCDLLNEHPRQDPDSLCAVRRMKPFWSACIECYDWIEEPFLHKYQDWHDDDGELFVGEYEDFDGTPNPFSPP